MAASDAQTTQQSTPGDSPDKWKLGSLESGLGGGGEKANQSQKTPSPQKPEVVTYPEGGVRAWLVVFGAWCATLASMGLPNSFGAFQSYFITHQLNGYSPSVVGWVFSVYLFLTFGGSLIVGPIFDQYGPTLLVLAGSIGACLSMFLIGICTKYWQILAVFGLLGGLSSALLVTPATAIVGHYFHKKRGHALGIAISSSPICGILLPLLLEALIPKMGFAWSTRVIGFIFVFASIAACTFMRSRLPLKKNSNARPDFRIFADSAFTITVIGFFLSMWAFYIPMSYISSYALYKGFSSAFAYHSLVFLNVGAFFGRWLPGFTSDKIGRYNSIIIMIILTVVSVLGIWLTVGHTKVGLVVFAVSYGFTSGSILTLSGVCIGQLCQTKNYGRYLSTAFAVASAAYLTGIPIAGDLVTRDHGDYQYLIIFVGACFGIAWLCFVSVRNMKTGWKLRVIY